MKQQIEERRTALSEAFHSLHQPLTGLHCGLELALLKVRTEAEYRERLQGALINAGSTLMLVRALRELAEAPDPGEQFGTVALEQTLEKLKEEISLLAEPELVKVSFEEVSPIAIDADPLKMIRSLGGILTYLIADMNPGGTIKLKMIARPTEVSLVFQTTGTKRAPEKSTEAQAREIRRDAAFEYVRTLEGTVRQSAARIELTLPVSKRTQTNLPSARSRTIGASASRNS